MSAAPASKSSLTVGILTSGGDSPGLNAAIRGVAKAAYNRGDVRIYGIANGFRGLIEGNARLMQPADFDGILTLGGTILGTSREKPYEIDPSIRDTEAGRRKPAAVRATYEHLGLDCLVVLGGNGTMRTAHQLERNGMNVIGLPKTIDNDIFGTDITFGFQSAVEVATEAIDRLHSTAHSHNRIMVIETMGHRAGWLALYAGVAGGGDVILIPEIPYDIGRVVSHLRDRVALGKPFSIVVVAEGALSTSEVKLKEEERESQWQKAGAASVGYRVARAIEETSGMETRVTVLGYLQRGGTPCSQDRVLATRLGTTAAEMIFDGRFGRMVAVEGSCVVERPLAEVAGKLKLVPAGDPTVQTAREIGTCLGDR